MFDESLYLSVDPNPANVMAELQRGQIIVLRQIPEILQLGEKILDLTFKYSGKQGYAKVKGLMETGSADNLEAIFLFYRAIRAVMDSRYISCLFSDLIKSFNLPNQILIDSSTFRIILKSQYENVQQRQDLFDPVDFVGRGPNDREQIFYKHFWGCPHRDIDVRHGHFQFNFWFPWHAMNKEQSLLFFPEAYRSDVPQYGKDLDPDSPSNWGLGHAMSVPLTFGDTLLFHSQVVHASPSQSPEKDRISTEIRVAAGALDGNERVYRRLYWNIQNFQTSLDEKVSPQERAEEYLTTVFDQDVTLNKALQGCTAHAVVHRLFLKPYSSLDAAFMNRSSEALSNMLLLNAEEWELLLSRLMSLPSGEDLNFMLARISYHQGFKDVSLKFILRILDGTQSFHWSLQAARLAEELLCDDIALDGFYKTIDLAKTSDFKLDRFTLDMPPPRSPGLLQLFPDSTISITEWFIKRIRINKLITPNPSGLDPTLLYGPEPPIRYRNQLTKGYVPETCCMVSE